LRCGRRRFNSSVCYVPGLECYLSPPVFTPRAQSICLRAERACSLRRPSQLCSKSGHAGPRKLWMPHERSSLQAACDVASGRWLLQNARLQSMKDLEGPSTPVMRLACSFGVTYVRSMGCYGTRIRLVEPNQRQMERGELRSTYPCHESRWQRRIAQVQRCRIPRLHSSCARACAPA